MPKDISVYYFNKKPNFGDLLNKCIPERLFGCKVTKADIESCNAVFIGSVLSPFASLDAKIKEELPELNIWGTGLIHPISTHKKFSRRINVCAVRGTFTKEWLEKSQKVKYDIPLGDPGLLCSLAFPDLDTTKEYDYGIIPHYIDQENPLLKKLQLPNSIILDICEAPEILLPKIVKCKKIISSAMHGLIAADSFGIPNIRLIVDDKIIGGDYKFNDYYSAFGLLNHKKLDLRNISHEITHLDIDYAVSQEDVKRIQNDLIRSFPYA